MVSDALDLVDLSDHAGESIKRLSGGMRQRLGLAQALVSEPSLLLLDEPTVGLDPAQRHGFLKVLVERIDMGQTTVVLATHLTDDVAAFAEEVVVLNQGRVAYFGTLERFCGAPRGVATGRDVERAFLAVMGSPPE
jgi:ABC-2 type transport system ATP-binding protein